MVIESTTATNTWLRVSIARSHVPKSPIASTTSRRRSRGPIRRESLQATSAVPPTIIHQGSPSRSVPQRIEAN